MRRLCHSLVMSKVFRTCSDSERALTYSKYVWQQASASGALHGSKSFWACWEYFGDSWHWFINMAANAGNIGDGSFVTWDAPDEGKPCIHVCFIWLAHNNELPLFHCSQTGRWGFDLDLPLWTESGGMNIWSCWIWWTAVHSKLDIWEKLNFWCIHERLTGQFMNSFRQAWSSGVIYCVWWIMFVRVNNVC